MSTSTQVTDSDLSSIVADASFLWERLNSKRFIVDSKDINATEIDRRCKRWSQTVAHDNQKEILQKRLKWDGLILEEVSPFLGKVKLVQGQTLPPWAKTLREIIKTAKCFQPNDNLSWPTNSDQPVPFEDVWLPAIQVARQNLLSHLSTTQLKEENLPLSILSQEAYTSLERSLLEQLSFLSAKTLDLEFSKARTFGQNLLNLLGVSAETSRNTRYHQFVDKLFEDGLFLFWQNYPVLARLIAVAVDFWVEATAEFIQRLANDYTKIEQVFNETKTEEDSTQRIPLDEGSQKKSALGKVTTLETSLSDPHNRGRRVLLLTFNSSLKLVYKPKDLGLEVAWNQFLNWCNQTSQCLDLKVTQLLNCEGYGWVEYIENQPCTDETAVERFYERAGLLLCLIYVLRGNDCHHENLIASGEHLVLIDMETLLHHDSRTFDDTPQAQFVDTESVQLFWDSVLRTGLLPRWDFDPNRQVAYDISGLGSVEDQQVPYRKESWQAINTDEMHLSVEEMTIPLEKNVPFLGENPLSANNYQKQIIAGFEQMYSFLRQHQKELLDAEGPLGILQQQSVRFIFRSTRVYFSILKSTWIPECLKNGVDFSIELDYLSRAFLVNQNQPYTWPLLRDELRAIEQLDIPYFSANTSSEALPLQHSQPIREYFKQSSYQQVLEQVQSLNHSDMIRQVDIIRGAFNARVAQSSASEAQSWQDTSLVQLSGKQFIEEAKLIAAQLEAKALKDEDGSLTWIGMEFEPKAERFQLQLLNNSLYDGRCGVALFFAGLYQVTQDFHYKDLCLRILQPLRKRLKTLDEQGQGRFTRWIGLGGATGLGSMIYAFVKITQFLSDRSLLVEAQILADLITPEIIASDQSFDIMSGVAGTALGLLSLNQVTPQASLLEKARICGEHLLEHQTNSEQGTKAWQTLGKKRLTGFSHGAAGIAYSLLRLYDLTYDWRYRDAALEAIDYERSVFSPAKANWPDFRHVNSDKTPSFVVQWCHGAAGIALGRLGSSDILSNVVIEQDIKVALETTRQQGLKDIDHLCCGNLGLIEVLLVAAKRYNQSNWRQTAEQKATTVVVRAKQSGAYQLFPNLPNSVFNPGFFQGLSGIGYELLRLADDNLPAILLWE